MHQATLFGDTGTPAKHLARRDDPVESHLSAEAITPEQLGRWEAYALERVEALPGRTGRELDASDGNTNRQISKRLSALAAKGLIRKGPARVCTVCELGRMAATWWPVGVGDARND